MPEELETTSLDEMRDMDEEDGPDGVVPAGTNRYVVTVLTEYEVDAYDAVEANEIWMEGEAEFIKEDDPVIYRKDLA